MKSPKPVFANIPAFSTMTGLTERAIRLAIQRGDLNAVRLEKRIVVEVAPGIAWVRSLPAVKQSAA